MAKRRWKVLHGSVVQRWSKSRIQRGFSAHWMTTAPRYYRRRYELSERRKVRVLLAAGPDRWDDIAPTRHRHSAVWDWF